MTAFKTVSFACIFAFSAPFISTAYADTVGCDVSYDVHDTYKSSDWKKSSMT